MSREIDLDSIPSGVPPEMRGEVVEFVNALFALDPEAVSIARQQLGLNAAFELELVEMAREDPHEMTAVDWAIFLALKQATEMGRRPEIDKTQWI